ncbi:MAG TPA: suppressor of fused domain protein [Polyangiaceae bacterium]|nr:suppressor of fused domain protein [Polyangiaceae bacterium]
MKELLKRVIAEREGRVYPELFGEVSKNIYTLDEEFFQRVFEQKAEPEWLLTGVLECPPSSKHKDYIYVSSGLSNPVVEQAEPMSPEDPSWLGVEVVFRTTEPGPWAVELVKRVAAFEILLAYQRFEGRDRLAPGARIPIGNPITLSSPSELTWLLVVPTKFEPPAFQLESGVVEFLQVIGITAAEAKLAREQGPEMLFDLLGAHGALSVTDPKRGTHATE